MSCFLSEIYDYKDLKNVSLGEIRDYMKKEKKNPFYTEERVAALRKLWAEMLLCAKLDQENEELIIEKEVC